MSDIKNRDGLPFEMMSPLVRADVLAKKLGFGRSIGEAVNDIVATSGGDRILVLDELGKLKIREASLIVGNKKDDRTLSELLKVQYGIALREAALERNELKP